MLLNSLTKVSAQENILGESGGDGPRPMRDLAVVGFLAGHRPPTNDDGLQRLHRRRFLVLGNHTVGPLRLACHLGSLNQRCWRAECFIGNENGALL